MNVELIRLATVHLENRPSPGAHTLIMPGIDGVLVELLGEPSTLTDGSLRLLLGATIQVDDQLDSGDGLLTIPAKPRRIAEFALGLSADYLALQYRTRRTILSPVPCFALRSDSPELIGMLQQLEEKASLGQTIALLPPDPGGSLSSGAIPLLDRLDGLALAAEAYSAGSDLGRFSEFSRLFERAFKLSSNDLAEALEAFLITGDESFGYDKAEVRTFIKTLRDKARHADRNSSFAMGPDLWRVLPRVEQAALDVLWNKRDWSDPSPGRRACWTPATGVGSDGTPFFDEGASIRAPTKLLDEFGVFATDLTFDDDPIPEGWWTPGRDHHTPHP